MLFEIKGIVKKGDYLYAKVPNHPNRTKNNYVLLHRVIMENHINRLLLPTEIVHHIDENKFNNDISNLRLMDSKEHNRMHSNKGRSIAYLTCANCGKIFVREQRQVKKNTKHHFCCRSCNGSYQRAHGWTGKKKRVVVTEENK